MIRKMNTRAVATPRHISSMNSRDVYVENWVPVRAGSQEHEKFPSRMGNNLSYRDGRKEVVQ